MGFVEVLDYTSEADENETKLCTIRRLKVVQYLTCRNFCILISVDLKTLLQVRDEFNRKHEEFTMPGAFDGIGVKDYVRVTDEELQRFYGSTYINSRKLVEYIGKKEWGSLAAGRLVAH